MSKDLMFRTTAFGGFRKDEVMDFIEKVLTEKSALERQLAINTAKTTQLNGELASLQSEIADIGKLRSDVAERKVSMGASLSLINIAFTTRK